MTEIKFGGSTYVGTAEGDHGVFTGSDGTVYAGQIAGRYPRVGVRTLTNGTTFFVECDADGEVHGRWLGCIAGGNTEYIRWEHGSWKEVAVLRADGTCVYDGKACRADYAPFVALQAMVVPIKARPALVPPRPPCFMPPFSRPSHRPPVGPIGHCFGTRRSWRRPTPTRCALALRPHRTHQIAMRIRRAHNLERIFFDIFRPGLAPRQALHFCSSLLFGRPGRRWPTRSRPKRRRRSVPPHTGRVCRKCLGSVRTCPVCAATTLVHQQGHPVAHSGIDWLGPTDQRPRGLAAAHTTAHAAQRRCNVAPCLSVGVVRCAAIDVL
jgi:hypothetical protein